MNDQNMLSKKVRINWKKEMIAEHQKGVDWHQSCIDRLKKEIKDIKQS